MALKGCLSPKNAIFKTKYGIKGVWTYPENDTQLYAQLCIQLHFMVRNEQKFTATTLPF